MSGFAKGLAGIVMALAIVSSQQRDVAAAPKHRPVASERWVTYENPRFGYRLYYPSALFDAQPPAENNDGRAFVSQDGRGKIVVYGTHNAEGISPAEYRQTILKEFPGYNQMDYSPLGKTWFVLSGYRGENIYYQKVIFSCNMQIINAISVTYPIDQKSFYESLIETIEDYFKPGRGADTPPGC